MYELHLTPAASDRCGRLQSRKFALKTRRASPNRIRPSAPAAHAGSRSNGAVEATRERAKAGQRNWSYSAARRLHLPAAPRPSGTACPPLASAACAALPATTEAKPKPKGSLQNANTAEHRTDSPCHSTTRMRASPCHAMAYSPRRPCRCERCASLHCVRCGPIWCVAADAAMQADWACARVCLCRCERVADGACRRTSCLRCSSHSSRTQRKDESAVCCGSLRPHCTHPVARCCRVLTHAASYRRGSRTG